MWASTNLLAGVVAQKIGQLAGVPEGLQRELVSVAATHDWDKRLEKEAHTLGGRKNAVGATVLVTNVNKQAEAEQGKRGLVRVTGGDLRDCET